MHYKLHLGKSGELRANKKSCFTLYWFSHKTYGSKKQQWSRKKKVTKNKCSSASGTPAVIVKCKKLNLVFCNNKLKFSLINVSRGVNFHATDPGRINMALLAKLRSFYRAQIRDRNAGDRGDRRNIKKVFGQ